MDQQQQQCQNCGQQFTIAPEDLVFYQKIKVPAPTFCPDCRLQRRFAWKNARSIYKRKCDLCGEDKIGVYSPDKPYKVYCASCWWSDKWDAMEYGQDYDPSKPFLDQFNELLHKVPLLNRFVYENTMVNSDYANMANDLKDCYLLFHAENSERCLYSEDISFTHDSLDTTYIAHSELCYQSFDIQKCSRVFFSKSCENCSNSYFLRDCVDCHNCFGSVNLRHKQYYIFNKPYTKETYEEELKKLGFDASSHRSIEEFKQKAREFQAQFPVKYIHARHNDNVSGEYIVNSKNVQYGFSVDGAEDCKFLCSVNVPKAKDSYDWTIYGGNGELMYEILQAGGNVYNNHFGWCIWLGARNNEYTILSGGDSSDCFGSIALRKKKYCILNKQYSQEDYEKLRAQIIASMDEKPYIDKKGRIYRYGEFFPAQFSPFGYNETGAQEEFPLDEQKATHEGYLWVDKEKSRGHYDITLKAEELPDTIHEILDDITQKIIACQQCQKPYRIIPQELEFYRTQTLPLPRKCVECRHLERLTLKNPFRLFDRTCQCPGNGTHEHGESPCVNTFQTSYTPERQDIVYCEACYLQEVA